MSFSTSSAAGCAAASSFNRATSSAGSPRSTTRRDPDGRYRVNELFCGNDGWRPAVTRLMAESDLVAMDLRGFSAGNQGCLFELQSLIDIVPVARVVLLTDGST